MPRKASSEMEERMRFVVRLPDGESDDRGLLGVWHIRSNGYKISDRCPASACGETAVTCPLHLWGTHYSSRASAQARPCKPLGV
jgi:hypothetical protein